MMNMKVLAARRNRHFTQAEFATKLGLNHIHVALIERHGWIPPKPLRQHIAKLLRVPEGDLFDVAKA